MQTGINHYRISHRNILGIIHGCMHVCVHVTEWVCVIVKYRGAAYSTHSHAHWFPFSPPSAGLLDFFDTFVLYSVVKCTDLEQNVGRKKRVVVSVESDSPHCLNKGYREGLNCFLSTSWLEKILTRRPFLPFQLQRCSYSHLPAKIYTDTHTPYALAFQN